MGRQNHIANAEGGSQCFRKGVDVNYLFRPINALQGWDGLAKKTEFAVVVIFDDVTTAFLTGPMQKLVAAAYRCSDACGELMGGGDVQDICTTAFQNFSLNALLIHG